MMKGRFFILCLIALLTLPYGYTYRHPIHHCKKDSLHQTGSRLEIHAAAFYNNLTGNIPIPGYEVFRKALTGYLNLKIRGEVQNNILTIIDFTLSSTVERMWIIDMVSMRVLHLDLVSHGRNSGDEFATRFSNIPSSFQSSLGFYLTGEIYYGQHGKSLYLDGVEQGINDKARQRAIVIHSAHYASRKFIDTHGRLGRSFGCPAIPVEGHERIIEMLAGKSCLYIHYPEPDYINKSELLNPESDITGIDRLLSEFNITNSHSGFRGNTLSNH